MKFNSPEYKQHFRNLAKQQGLGGYTGKQRTYLDTEIQELVDRYYANDCENTHKSLFSEKTYDSPVKWKNDVSRHLDENSRKKFYFLIEKHKGLPVCAAQKCEATLGIDSFNHVGWNKGFSKYCPSCTASGVWRFSENYDPAALQIRGKKISESKKEFYKTDQGKKAAASIGKKNSVNMRAYNSTKKGQETIRRNAKKSSKRMKQKILSGEFTPQIKNSRTHWQVEYNGQKYRSSWEAMWQALNLDHLYEHTRIPYTFDGVEKIYIVDFTDTQSKTLYEIKPTEHTTDTRVKAKEKAANEWCTKHGYKFKIITQKELILRKNELLESDLPLTIKNKVLKLYEKN